MNSASCSNEGVSCTGNGRGGVDCTWNGVAGTYKDDPFSVKEKIGSAPSRDPVLQQPVEDGGEVARPAEIKKPPSVTDGSPKIPELPTQ